MTYKEDFIGFLAQKKALRFGEFTLKSGRSSPYFINTGMFNDGESIAQLGYFYASKIRDTFGYDFDVVFGPAYKGIPLALTTCMSLAKDFKLRKGYFFDRKEIKDHAERSAFVGAKIEKGHRIVIVDDVLTTGKTLGESIEKIRLLADVDFKSVVISVDRQESVNGENALKSFEDRFGVPVLPIVTITEIKEYLHNRDLDGTVYVDDAIKAKMDAYGKEHGVV